MDDVAVQEHEFVPGGNADCEFALPVAGARRAERQKPMLCVVGGPHDFQPLAPFIDCKTMVAEVGRPGLTQVEIFDVLGKVIRAESVNGQINIAPIGSRGPRRSQESRVAPLFHEALGRHPVFEGNARKVAGQLAIGSVGVFGQAELVEEVCQSQLGSRRGSSIGPADLPQQKPLGMEQVVLLGEFIHQERDHGAAPPDETPYSPMNRSWNDRSKRSTRSASPATANSTRARSDTRHLRPRLFQLAGDPLVEIDGHVRIVGPRKDEAPPIGDRQATIDLEGADEISLGNRLFGRESLDQKPFVPGAGDLREPRERAVARRIVLPGRGGQSLEERRAVRGRQPRVDPLGRHAIEGRQRQGRIMIQESDFGLLHR